jgi:chaperonin cofactor prefoldin
MSQHKEDYEVEEKRVWEKVMHTDARVTAMESQIKDVSISVNRIETMLLNKQETSPLAWFGVIFSVLTLVGGLVWTMTQYMALQLDPIEADLKSRDAVVQAYYEFKNQTHYEMGQIHAYRDAGEKEIDHLHERYHNLQDRVNRLEHNGTVTKERLNGVEAHAYRGVGGFDDAGP